MTKQELYDALDDYIKTSANLPGPTLNALLKDLYETIESVVDNNQSVTVAELQALAQSLIDETTARQQADTTEIAVRQASDQTLQQNINDETTARQSADQAESDTRAGADSVLQQNINSEATTRQQADDLEASTRQAADNLLSAQIASETVNRQTGDQTLQQNIDNESSARQTSDQNIQQNIDNEASTREGADNILQQRITSEYESRQFADDEIWAAIQGTLYCGIERDITNQSVNCWIPINRGYVKTFMDYLDVHRYIEDSVTGLEKYRLHPNDSRFRENGIPAVLDGTDGNFMVGGNGFYFRLTLNGNTERRLFSPYALPGFIWIKPFSIGVGGGQVNRTSGAAASVCSLVFNTDGSLSRDAVTGLLNLTANAVTYRGGNNDAAWDNTYQDLRGMPATAQSAAQIFSATTAAGANFHFGFFRVNNILSNLFYLLYLTTSVQAAYNSAVDEYGLPVPYSGLGQGTAVNSTEWNTHNGYYPFIPNGVTATLGNRTGRIDYTIKNWANSGTDKVVQVVSFLGSEQLYEYLWIRCADLLIYHQNAAEGGKSTAYLCSDESKLTSPATTTSPAPDGYLAAGYLPRTSGYILTVTNDFNMIPTAIGAAANTGFADYLYTPSDFEANYGWFASVFSGDADSGTGAGLRYLSTNRRVTIANANWTFRLCSKRGA